MRKGKIESIQHPKVLVYGATGAVGTAAVQIARHYGATVTAVCSSRGKELTQSLGADHIILYDQEDFTQLPDKFDIILDAVGKTSKKQCKHLLTPKGKFLSVEGMDIAAERTEYLGFLRKLYEDHQYQATIDKVYPMEKAVDAHTHVDSGRKKGNVVLAMGDD